MWRTRALVALLLVAAGLTVAVGGGARSAHANPANRLTINGRSVFLNGVNVPWGVDKFGSDIGCNYDANSFESMFSNLQAYGVNSVRFWVHVDGRCSPSFDGNNAVTGVPANFYPNLDDFLGRARNHNVAVLLTLWAPELTFTSSAYLAIRPARTSFINDSGRTQSYIDNVLVPMAQRYNDNPAVLGYEVINEPEFTTASDDVWGSGNGNTGPGDRDLIQLSTMQRFVAQQVVALHKNTSKYVVAAGSGAYKWLSANHVDATVGNWWSDAALRAQVGGSDQQYAYSDFYQVHWYDWEKGDSYDFSPWEGRGPTFYNSDDKPVVIGEMPAKDDAYFTRDTKINDTYNLGYLGYFFWSYNGIDGYGGWADIKDKLKAFHDAHAGEVDLDLGGSGNTGGSGNPGGTGGGNTRSGSWAAKLAAQGGWRNLTQIPNVSGNTSYTATVYLRGSGTIDFRIHAGEWGAELGGNRCTATGSWQPCQIIFDSGGNNRVTFRLTDSTSGGTIYLDDASLSSGGGNLLNNGDFEQGASSWGVESPFAIVQNP
ncbi:cellulase family glycosylhydrolase [Plantactinospora siamensis]|uniref:Cellulase family glycosylhydrolase n=1 Tax=Plantactinospora siamensis TaxID=555372 RepID=A0ABV6P3C5_9ACTN